MKKRKGRSIYPVLILICLAVMGLSVFKLVTITLEYKKGEKEYTILQSYTSERTSDKAEESDQAGDTVGTEKEENSSKRECPITVDFEQLKSINPDIVGWLYIPILEVSYPVVQGRDNEQYLHHTFEGTENFAGSIFVEAAVKHPFEDCHTIVYGHSMKNQTMFGKLKLLLPDQLYQQDPCFWILTPEGDREYQMINIQYTEAGSSIYTIFESAGETFLSYLKEIEAASEIKQEKELQLTENTKLVTLSTCAAAEGIERLIVQGIEIDSAQQ